MLAVDPKKHFYDSLPDEPGVYLFYDNPDSLPLYIGKSVAIKKRVQSHYSQAKRELKEQRLMSKVSYIDWITTAGEISALLLEARLVKEKLPMFNRRLRRLRTMYSFRLDTHNSVLLPELIQYQLDNVELYANQYGIFRSKRQAWQWLDTIIVKEALCRKLLGLESGTGPCFNYQLKRCRGVCNKQESVQQHNTRLESAISLMQQQPWPYAGAIVLEEHNSENNKVAKHVIDNWCYRGELGQNQIAASSQFDLDMYKILVNAINSDRKELDIYEIEQY